MTYFTATAEDSILTHGHLQQYQPGWDRPGGVDLLVREPFADYRPRYLDLRKDFTFKHVFGKESNKDLLTDFLSNVFQGRKVIGDLRYGPMERQGGKEEVRKVTFDIQCASDQNVQYFIEMQQRYQESFFRRLLYYAMRLGSEQLPAGKVGDKYPMPKICGLAVLNYDPWKDLWIPPGQENECINTYRLGNIKNGHPYPAGFELTLVELPKFNKNLDDLRTNLDKWLYALKNLDQLQEQPVCFNGPVFDKLFQLSENQKLNEEDIKMIVDQERERRNEIEAYRMEGEAIGEKRGEQRGEKRMKELKERLFVQALIREGIYDDRKIALMTGVDGSFVRQERRSLRRGV